MHHFNMTREESISVYPQLQTIDYWIRDELVTRYPLSPRRVGHEIRDELIEIKRQNQDMPWEVFKEWLQYIELKTYDAVDKMDNTL